MSTNIILHILKTTDLNQKDIATKIGVSTAQVSKWKAGEAIPLSRLEALNKLAGLFGANAEWAVIAETAQNADAWVDYFEYLQSVSDGGQCGGVAEDSKRFVPELFVELSKAGIGIPKTAPVPNKDGEYGDEDTGLASYDEPEGEVFDLFLRELLCCFAPMSRWRERYLSMTDDDVMDDWCCEIEDALAIYSLTWVSDEALMPVGLSKATTKSLTSVARRGIIANIKRICRRMNQQALPFEVDYFQIVHADPDSLDTELLIDSTFCDIERQLPYASRRLLRESRESQAILLELHLKVDTLLSSEAAEMLSAKLEHCRPDHQTDP